MKKLMKKSVWFLLTMVIVLVSYMFYTVSQAHAHQVQVKQVSDYNQAQEDVFFEEFKFQEEADLYELRGCAGTDRFIEEYHNWVLGEGNGVHFIVSFVLIQEDTVYVLKTIPDYVNVDLEEEHVNTYGASITSRINKENVPKGTYQVGVILTVDDVEELYVSEEVIELGGSYEDRL